VTRAEGKSAGAALGRLEGQICQDVLPSIGDVTKLGLKFGAVIKRYPALQATGRPVIVYEFSTCCDSAWRLDSADEVLCSFDDEKPRGGKIQAALAALKGQMVTNVEFAPPAGDLAIHFENGQVLRFFCCVAEGDHTYTWDYYFSDRRPGREVRFQVGPRGLVDFDWPHGGDPE
jgi:hypothetical protein